jgi:uncharacterized membrane protein YgdD (TMEM256/DUF423 family)
MLIGTMKAAAGVLGITGVTLGAFGAHGLKAKLAARGMTEAWHIGVQYHLVHALALLALTALCMSTSPQNTRWLTRAALAWIVGVVLFSGSLYAMALDGPKQLGFITPLGGTAFLAGWAFLLIPFRETRDASKN